MDQRYTRSGLAWAGHNPGGSCAPITPSRRVRIAPTAASLALAAGLATGCATLDEDECRTADWVVIGYEDGAQGRQAAHIGEHREACAEYGIAPDIAAYNKGRGEGLKEYCRAANAYRLGRSGRGHSGVCPAPLLADFQPAYDAGRRVYQAESQLKSAKREIQRKERELERTEKNLNSRVQELVASDTSAERRIELLSERDTLVERQANLKHEISGLQSSLEDLASRLKQLEEAGY